MVVVPGAGIRVRAGAGIRVGSRLQVLMSVFVVTHIYWLCCRRVARLTLRALLAFVKGNIHRDWDARNVLLRTGFVARSMPSAHATELDLPLKVQQPQESTIRLNC